MNSARRSVAHSTPRLRRASAAPSLIGNAAPSAATAGSPNTSTAARHAPGIGSITTGRTPTSFAANAAGPPIPPPTPTRSRPRSSDAQSHRSAAGWPLPRHAAGSAYRIPHSSTASPRSRTALPQHRRGPGRPTPAPARRGCGPGRDRRHLAAQIRPHTTTRTEPHVLRATLFDGHPPHPARWPRRVVRSAGSVAGARARCGSPGGHVGAGRRPYGALTAVMAETTDERAAGIAAYRATTAAARQAAWLRGRLPMSVSARPADRAERAAQRVPGSRRMRPRATRSSVATTASVSAASRPIRTSSWAAPAWTGSPLPMRTPTNAPATSRDRGCGSGRAAA